MTEPRYAHGIMTVTWGKFNPHIFFFAILADRPIFVNGKRYDSDVIIDENDTIIIIEGIDCPYDFDYPDTLDDEFGNRTEQELLKLGDVPAKPQTVKLGLKLDYCWEFWNPVADVHISFRLIGDVLIEPFEIWEM